MCRSPLRALRSPQGRPLPEQLDRARGAADGLRDQLMLSLSELTLLARIIPRDTLAFRLSLLGAGCAEVNSRLEEIDTPVFIFAGGADLLVQSGADTTEKRCLATHNLLMGASLARDRCGATPCANWGFLFRLWNVSLAASEGPRLAGALRNSTLEMVPMGSHMLLQEGASLKEALLRNGFYETWVEGQQLLKKRQAGGQVSLATAAASAVMGSAAAVAPVAVVTGVAAAADVSGADSDRGSSESAAGAGASSSLPPATSSSGSSTGGGGNGGGSGSSSGAAGSRGDGGGGSGGRQGKRGPLEIKLGKDALPTPEAYKRVEDALRITRRLVRAARRFLPPRVA